LGFFFGTFGLIDYLVKYPLFNNIYPFGYICAIAFFSIISYAIVRRELFGIRVVLIQVLVVVVAILLLAGVAQAVVMKNWVDFAWKLPLFFLFLVFGYILVQTVIQVMKQRAEVQRLYEEVDRLSRAKSEFISIASHQLRTPLTAIKGYISMLIEGTYGKIEGKPQPPLEKVYQSNERLINLVNDLLNISRIESGTLKLDFEKTSLENMISSVLDELKIKADEKKLYLKREKVPSAGSGQALPEINIDPGKLRQVIMNIIDNCIKYTEEGGINVKTELREASERWPRGSILVTIKDTGEGMTQEEIDGMFESFTRGKAGVKHWSSGLGLGLYIAKKFSEAHDGKIWAESEGPGKGSTFYVEIPVK